MQTIRFLADENVARLGRWLRILGYDVANEVVTPICRQAVQQLVPSYVYQTQQVFHQCPVCEHVYWRGSHVNHTVRQLAK